MTSANATQPLDAAFPANAARATRLLTADQLAERWVVSKPAVYRMAREGKVPTIWIGRYCRFSLAAIEAWEQAQEGRSDV